MSFWDQILSIPENNNQETDKLSFFRILGNKYQKSKCNFLNITYLIWLVSPNMGLLPTMAMLPTNYVQTSTPGRNII